MRARIDHPEDRGDLEQSPPDLTTVLDYQTMTAMLAPRPASCSGAAYSGVSARPANCVDRRAINLNRVIDEALLMNRERMERQHSGRGIYPAGRHARAHRAWTCQRAHALQRPAG